MIIFIQQDLHEWFFSTTIEKYKLLVVIQKNTIRKLAYRSSYVVHFWGLSVTLESSSIVASAILTFHAKNMKRPLLAQITIIAQNRNVFSQFFRHWWIADFKISFLPFHWHVKHAAWADWAHEHIPLLKLPQTKFVHGMPTFHDAYWPHWICNQGTNRMTRRKKLAT